MMKREFRGPVGPAGRCREAGAMVHSKATVPLSVILAGAFVIQLLLRATPSIAASSDPYYIAENPKFHRVVLVGCTLGNNWSGFLDRMAPDYSSTASDEKLDVELQLYVTWVLDTNVSVTPTEYNPPKPINDAEFVSWFNSSISNTFKVVDIEYDGESGGTLLNREYTTCANNAGLESPTAGSFPLTTDGKLRVTDVHGGIADKTMIHLQRCTPHEEDECAFEYHLHVGWHHPKTHFDDKLGSSVPLVPGSTWHRKIIWGDNLFFTYVPMRIVQWVSTDMAGSDAASGPSPGAVDAGDLSSWAPTFGQPVYWGFDGGPAANFRGNVAPGNNNIDAGDLSGMVADLGLKTCSLSKASAEAEREAIVTWFGYAPTGREIAIGPNGTRLVPEYALVDSERNARAIADPYGYERNQTNATRETPWGHVKALYR